MFWFYTIPLLVCILTGVYFFTGEKKNIALGLIMCVLGLIPFFNMFFACIGILVLIVMACKGN
jgi:hypothetical protein